MFGFVVADPGLLTEEQREHYKGVYCGLCEELSEDRKALCRMTLTYDLTFLAIVLSAVYNEDYIIRESRCPVHPLKKRRFERNRFTEYAADMNIALAYYKYLDDKKDDGSVSASLKAVLFRKEMEDIRKKYPEKCECIRDCLKELEEVEKADILIPDVPAGIFGKLLGNVFLYEGNDTASPLYAFGEALGKFIYILDAAVDLKKDIKKQKYNPLVRFGFKDTEPVLQMIMAECTEKYKELNISKDKEIIENILFSGVWTAFDTLKERKNK